MISGNGSGIICEKEETRCQWRRRVSPESVLEMRWAGGDGEW